MIKFNNFLLLKAFIMKTIYSPLKMTLLIAMMILFSTELVTAQGWYNTNWLYRTPITITNSGSALTDYQVQVSLGTSFAWGHTYNNGADVRFTTSDGLTSIPFYIESWVPSASASIWVRVPSVSSRNNNYIYVLWKQQRNKRQ